MKNYLTSLCVASLILTSASYAQLSLENTEPKSHGEVIVLEKNTKQARTARHSHHQDAWIDSVEVSMLTDLNGNGYYSRFSVTFDADTRFQRLDTYAVLSLSNGLQDWTYFQTETLTLRGTRGDDAYRVTTTLTEAYPTDVYSITIKLYDATTKQLLATADRYNYPALNAHYLESSELDSQQHSQAYIDYHRVELFDALDSSGYFSSLKLTVDVDYPQRSEWVRVNMLVDVPGRGWRSLFKSDSFQVSGVQRSDRQDFTVYLDTGYPRGDYRYKLQVTGAYSGLILDEFYAHSDARLALQSRDMAAHSGGSTHTVYTEETYYGGSLSFGFSLVLLLVLLGRYLENPRYCQSRLARRARAV